PPARSTLSLHDALPISGESCERVDQTDVGAFRRFDRADAAVMGRVNVADFEACALAGQTTRSKSRKTTLVGDFRKRVHLVHELRDRKSTRLNSSHVKSS